LTEPLGPADRFTAGAVGPPGQRVFYLEVSSLRGVQWYLVEKEQVAMLAEAALEILERRGPTTAAPAPPLSGPDEPAFRVGRISLGMVDDQIEVTLVPVGESAEDDPLPSGSISFTVGPALLEGMARRAVAVVAAGRPPCPWCSLPRDPGGHTCPASNGHLGK
jgi:uncharacterized repeat protein (TIGR03847 family)